MNNIYVLKRLLSYVRRLKFRLIVLILISLLGVVIEVAKPFPVKVVIDNVFSGQPLSNLISGFFGDNIPDKPHLIFYCVMLIALITITGAIISITVSNLTVKLSQSLVYDLCTDLFSKLQQLSLSFYSRNQVGDLMQRITADVFVVYFLVAQIIVPVVTSFICLCAMFYVMARIDTALAFIALSVVPLLGITLTYFNKPMNDSTHHQHTAQGEMSSFLQQSLSSVKIIQAFARESFINKKLRNHAWKFGTAFEKATRTANKYNLVVSLITGLASAGLIGLGAYKGLKGHLSIGDLYIFLGYIAALYGPVNSLSTAIGTAVVISSRGKRVFEILDSQEVVKIKPGAHVFEYLNGDVKFENVAFGYGLDKNKDRAVLNDINFHVMPGQVVAIVGETGSGKTSLISMIARFYDPWSGKVLIDGFDLRDVDVHSLREHISLVLQDAFLFPMSITDNIAFGNPSAIFDEIVEAAKNAEAHDFIQRLPEKYNTIITESGASLSGGEKQRIALARAFLKKSSILILDEPTSAMDALTESKIIKQLQNIAKNKTVFLISHRLSTIKNADLIITLRDGRVVEAGTHENLLDNADVYASLYKHQHIS
jgi:ATP-binding cassette subfamily B protein